MIPNGVDLERFEVPAPPCTLRDEYGIPCEDALIGVVARLEAEKGHTHLIAAMPGVLARAPRTWLAIVGDGSLRGELEAQARALPAPARDRIVFTGARDDISAITADLDVAVLPSLREAQGISILEAMARRKPVVASAVGGIPEVLTHGLDGFLVPPADPSALADALAGLARSPSLRERVGEAGYATVRERFSIEAQVRRIEDLYAEELQRAGIVGSARPGRRGPTRGSERGRAMPARRPRAARGATRLARRRSPHLSRRSPRARRHSSKPNSPTSGTNMTGSRSRLITSPSRRSTTVSHCWSCWPMGITSRPPSGRS